MRKLVIVGTGAQGRCALEIAQSLGVSVQGFLDFERAENAGKSINGAAILGSVHDLERLVNPKDTDLVIAIGQNRRKAELVQRLGGRYPFATLVSPAAYVATTARLGKGCIVFPRVVVMPNAVLEDHVKIDAGSVVSHDNLLETCSSLAPGVSLAGHVTVGREAYVYTAACVIPKVKIGAGAIVGAGAVVLDEVPAGATVVGNPAKILEKS